VDTLLFKRISALFLDRRPSLFWHYFEIGPLSDKLVIWKKNR
jgi:hypothetical protein